MASIAARVRPSKSLKIHKASCAKKIVAKKDDDLRRPKEDLMDSLKETEDLSKCKSYSSLDELLSDLRSKHGNI
jgi:hypothetical protein